MSEVTITKNQLSLALQIAGEFGTQNRLREALENLLNRYLDLVNSGDCGHWNPEKEDEVIAARRALVEREENANSN